MISNASYLDISVYGTVALRHTRTVSRCRTRLSVSRAYLCVTRVSLSRARVSASHTYLCVARVYLCVRRAYLCVARVSLRRTRRTRRTGRYAAAESSTHDGHVWPCIFCHPDHNMAHIMGHIMGHIMPIPTGPVRHLILGAYALKVCT